VFAAVHTDRMIPLVIDADPGIDDALAIWLAVRSPEFGLAAISTSFGNTTLDNATRNAREVLRRVGGLPLPIFPGADRPWSRSVATATESHGASGLGYAEVPPAPKMQSDPAALLRALETAGEDVTLVTLGPLTNLALALAMHPSEVKARVTRHVAMAGNLSTRGNVTVQSEFNAWSDPEALWRVLEAELPTTLVPLDATRALTLSAEDIAAVESGGPPHGPWLGRALRCYLESHRRHEGFDGCILHDPLAMVAALDSTVLTVQQVPLAVSLAPGEQQGQTRIVGAGRSVSVAVGADGERARALLRERVLPWIPEAT
jgi:inosine-uridine nucleoside N-ribohydrolase